MSDPVAFVLLALCLILLFTPPSRDPAIKWKERSTKAPECFGTYPFYNGHIHAERGCGDCPRLMDCHEDTPYWTGR